jgi:hypothetical protein
VVCFVTVSFTITIEYVACSTLLEGLCLLDIKTLCA